ncbi:EthD domain-containing protein [Gordonia aurantiaca]|uniref:EthD domain-containing protein n=1 Tax=Gordonia sp. B21 TaxID=3151852 RepID=UPI00326393DC
MFNVLMLAKARVGLSREAFIDAHETRHAPLLAERAPELRHYARRYLTPVGGPTADATALPYDVMIELGFDSPTEFSVLARRLAEGDPDDEIARSRTDLFEPGSAATAEVDEHITVTPPAGTDTDRMFQAVTFLRQRPDMSRAEFIDYYETRHAVLAAGLLPDARHYARRYLTPIPDPATGRTRTIRHDAVNELWFDSADAFAATMSELSRPETLAQITEDEKQLFDREATRLVTIELHRTR